MKLSKAPVLIRLNPDAVYSADLDKEIRIDKHRLDSEIRHQADKYLWWAALYAEVSYKVSVLEEELGRVEAELYDKYERRYHKQYLVKKKVRLNSEYRELSDKVRRWKRSESLLKFAEKAFAQRKDLLQTLSANTRREKERT